MNPVEVRANSFHKLGSRLAAALVAVGLAVLASAPATAQAASSHTYQRQKTSGTQDTVHQNASGQESGLGGRNADGSPAAPSAHIVPRRDGMPAALGGPKLPTTGALFGASSNVLGVDIEGNEQVTMQFESLIGRKLAVKRVYYSWNDVFPTDYEYWMRDRGTTPILSWTTSLAGVPIVTWKDVAAGRYDATIDARAAGLKAYGAPLFFVFHHEPEGEGDPADYVAAYKHIHDRFVADGVTNVSYGWVLMDYTFRIGPAAADQWYPGSSYVDIIGSDQYNWYTCPGHEAPWNDFQSLAQPFYDYGVSKGKPMMLGEWAAREDTADSGRKADWITAAASTLKSWPEVKVVAWYENGAGGDVCLLDVDTSQSATRAFTNMGADPYFNPPPPLVFIDSGPANLDNHSTITFAFHSNIQASTFTCKLDAGSSKSCSSPYTLSNLSQGDHTLKITAKDPQSGQSTYSNETWTVDSIPPVASINYGPNANTSETSATFQLASNEGHGQFTCSLDGAPSVDCGWSITYSNLLDAVHNFKMTSYDDAGNRSAPVSWVWTVDTIPPIATITSAPNLLSSSQTAEFEFDSNEEDGIFKCSLDGGTYVTCSSGKTYYALSDGTHTFKVEAIDLASNTGPPDRWTWVVDDTPPVTTITSGPSDPTWSSMATFVFTASELGVTFTCQLDAGAPSTCLSPKIYTGISVDRHTFTVYATDLAGNVGKVSNWSWSRIT
jgi:hypothetical protein